MTFPILEVRELTNMVSVFSTDSPGSVFLQTVVVSEFAVVVWLYSVCRLFFSRSRLGDWILFFLCLRPNNGCLNRGGCGGRKYRVHVVQYGRFVTRRDRLLRYFGVVRPVIRDRRTMRYDGQVDGRARPNCVVQDGRFPL